MLKISKRTNASNVERSVARKQGLGKVLSPLCMSVLLAFSASSTGMAASVTGTNAKMTFDLTRIIQVTLSGSDIRNHGLRAVVSTLALLRMNMSAVQQLFWDHHYVFTYDGLSSQQVRLLWRVMEFDRAYIRDILQRYRDIRGAEYRKQFLDREIQKNAEQRARNREALKRTGDSNIVTEAQLPIVAEENRLHDIWELLASLRKNTNVGPGGTVRINP